jgi:hypothetical protein
MMLGFVVRRCTVAIGHAPSPEEFAGWANNYRDGDRTVCLFGRAISVDEARLILRHPGRAVTAYGAAPHEQLREDNGSPQTKVTSFAAAAARLQARRVKS